MPNKTPKPPENEVPPKSKREGRGQINVQVDEELRKALDRYLAIHSTGPVKATITGVIEHVLREFLKNEKLWPPPKSE